MNSALLKAILLAVSAQSTYYSLSPPNPPAAKSERTDKILFDRWVHWVTWTTKTLLWAIVAVDSLITLADAISIDKPKNAICPASAELSFISPFLVGATALAFLSALLRRSCFKALGSLFTFEVTIRPKHLLITDGPYSWVRHPSYVGVYGILIGSTTILLSRGTLFAECGFYPFVHRVMNCVNSFVDVYDPSAPSLPRCLLGATLRVFTSPFELFTILLLLFWFVKICFALSSAYKRTITEDDELHRKFGDEWVVYAKTVKWRLFPGVF